MKLSQVVTVSKFWVNNWVLDPEVYLFFTLIGFNHASSQCKFADIGNKQKIVLSKVFDLYLLKINTGPFEKHIRNQFFFFKV